MAVTFSPLQRGIAAGGVAAAALVGAFALGNGLSGASPSSSASAGQSPGGAHPAVLAATTGTSRITVTGTGNVTGTPDQLVLSMGVQVNGSSVGSALASANAAVTRVTSALRAGGVAAADIQTAGLSIWPNYQPGSSTPDGYSVTESITATLNRLSAAGAQIDSAARAGGDATTVSGVSLNLTDTSALLAQARARAIADATAKATQYAKALGVPLGPVVSVTDQAAALPPPELQASGAAAAKSVPISPGTQQLSVSVTVVFAA